MASVLPLLHQTWGSIDSVKGAHWLPCYTKLEAQLEVWRGLPDSLATSNLRLNWKCEGGSLTPLLHQTWGSIGSVKGAHWLPCYTKLEAQLEVWRGLTDSLATPNLRLNWKCEGGSLTPLLHQTWGSIDSLKGAHWLPCYTKLEAQLIVWRGLTDSLATPNLRFHWKCEGGSLTPLLHQTWGSIGSVKGAHWLPCYTKLEAQLIVWRGLTDSLATPNLRLHW